MPPKRAIVMNGKDNTATTVEAIEPGTDVTVNISGQEVSVLVVNRIPFAHKFSLTAIARGKPIIKYGEVIGYATEDIGIGEHVHVHNLESGRGRGDKLTSRR